MKKISIISLAFLFAGITITNAMTATEIAGGTVGSTAVACTMDAKICPDGSAVGRVGPNCEFSPCPGGIGTKPIKPPIVQPIESPYVKDNGFMQFNNLTVQSVSGTSFPAEITASEKQDYIMMNAEKNGTTPAQASGTSFAAQTKTVSSVKNCYRFTSATATKGENIPCPIASSSVSSGASPDMNLSMPYPEERTYRIKIDASSKLLLRERTSATLSDFSAGDKINVFGYYNSDGSITAYMVRNLTKPVVQQTLQLNNVTLVSVSGNALAVVQEVYTPCRYYLNGAPTDNIACPMGVSGFEANAATKSVQKPDFISNWQNARKYVVNVDAQTVLLDRNRGKLAVADLRIGDKLNIYGDTADNGQTITADIVRDLSLPPAVSTYSGTVSAVNADGSFTVQTEAGTLITVKNPFSVGSKIKITGLLDSANILSQITQINFGGNIKPIPISHILPMTTSSSVQ